MTMIRNCKTRSNNNSKQNAEAALKKQGSLFLKDNGEADSREVEAKYFKL
jgi:hypothetical protein